MRLTPACGSEAIGFGIECVLAALTAELDGCSRPSCLGHHAIAAEEHSANRICRAVRLSRNTMSYFHKTDRIKNSLESAWGQSSEVCLRVIPSRISEVFGDQELASGTC